MERSFVDVSDEADAIRDDSRHSGLYVNNNEKCDEFEVIDDGSQQGGMSRFEDKSFEMSGRSSLLSSIRADGVSESMESEIPFDISVDYVKAEQKDEYDIVHMDESSKHRLDVSSMTKVRRTPSPDVTSDINIGKYLLSDEDEDNNDDSQQNVETFSVNKYFASEDVSSIVDDVPLSEAGAENILTEDHNENVPLNYENIESKELFTSPQSNIASLLDSTERCSPYFEVEAHTTKPVDDPLNEAFVEQTGSDLNIEQTEIFDDDDDDTVGNIVNIDVVPESMCSDEDSMESPIKSESPVTLDSSTLLADTEQEVVLPVEEVNNENTSGNSMSTPSVEEGELLETEEIGSKPHIVDAGLFTEQKPFEVRTASLSEHEKNAVRQDVVSLYDQIAGEAIGTVPKLDSSDQLPDDATFGVFGVTGKIKEEINEETKEDVKPKPEGWLVRVESFTAPKNKLQSPEITIVNPEFQPEAPEENPVPKERSKKKKNKNNKSVKNQSTAATSPFHEAPTPSAPELLGFSADVENNANPQPSPPTMSKKSSLKDADIPKQFLDVSHEFGESYSDTSDVEREEGEREGDGKKRKGSKKNSKKENCKTQ